METCPHCNTTADVLTEYATLEAEHSAFMERHERPEPSLRDEFLRVGLLRRLRLDCRANHDPAADALVDWDDLKAELGLNDLGLEGDDDHAEATSSEAEDAEPVHSEGSGESAAAQPVRGEGEGGDAPAEQANGESVPGEDEASSGGKGGKAKE